MTQLDQIAVGTALYGPSTQLPGCYLFVLLAGEGPWLHQIQLENVWSDTGPPAKPSVILFVNTEVSPEAAPDFCQAVTQALFPPPTPAPACSDIAWILYDPSATPATSVTVAAAISVAPGAADAPVVAVDATINLPVGMSPIGLLAGSPVRATAPGALTGLLVGCPPQADTPLTAGPPAIQIALLDDLVGTLAFLCLIGGDTLSLYSNQIDVLNPFGGRSIMISQNQNFTIVQGPKGPSLEPSP